MAKKYQQNLTNRNRELDPHSMSDEDIELMLREALKAHESLKVPEDELQSSDPNFYWDRNACAHKLKNEAFEALSNIDIFHEICMLTMSIKKSGVKIHSAKLSNGQKLFMGPKFDFTKEIASWVGECIDSLRSGHREKAQELRDTLANKLGQKGVFLFEDGHPCTYH